MKYDNQILLCKTDGPRAKFSYKDIDEQNKLLKNPLADDFQQEIKDSPLLAVHGDDRYPISGRVSLYIELKTFKAINLLGVAKNIMDGCIGIIYTDDSVVESILISKIPQEKGMLDRVSIKVINGKPIRNNKFDQPSFDSYSLLGIEIDTVAEDNYMPYPPSNAFREIVNPNDDAGIKALLEIECRKAEIRGKVNTLSITVDIADSKVDVDNLCLNYITNLTGIAYEDLDQIESLHLMKNSNSSDQKVLIRFIENQIC